MTEPMPMPRSEKLARRFGSSDPSDWPNWAQFVRQAIIFFLGVAAIVYAMISSGTNWGYIIAGLILIGMIPIENLLDRFPRQKRPAA